MSGPEGAVVACRLLLFGAAMFLWGMSAYLALLVPARVADMAESKLRVTWRIALVIVPVVTLLLLPLRAATVGDGWGDAVSPDTLEAVLFETNIGEAWMAQALATVLLLAAATLAPARRRRPAAALAAALLLATQVLTGHASMHPGPLGMFHRINDVLHLLMAGGWLGALAPVLVILPMIGKPGLGRDAVQALMRFSTIGHVVVALTIATGAINLYLVVGGLPFDWAFPYQLLLAIKILLVGVMTAQALVNRYLFVPRLSHHTPGALEALVRGTKAEIVLSASVLLLVAWLGTLEPM